MSAYCGPLVASLSVKSVSETNEGRRIGETLMRPYARAIAGLVLLCSFGYL